MRVTGQVLPVLEHQQWQVETMHLDLGTGLRPWIEIRHGEDELWHVATVAERDAVLREHGVDPAALKSVDVIDDGCE